MQEFVVDGKTFYLTQQEIELLRRCYFRPCVWCEKYCAGAECPIYRIKIEENNEEG